MIGAKAAILWSYDVPDMPQLLLAVTAEDILVAMGFGLLSHVKPDKKKLLPFIT